MTENRKYTRVLCHLWPIVLALWDLCKTGWLWLWSSNILCVCLWQHHCSVSLPLLVCFDVHTTVCCIHTYKKAKADEQGLKVCFCIIWLVIWDLAVTQPGTISEEIPIYSTKSEAWSYAGRVACGCAWCKQFSITHSKIHVHSQLSYYIPTVTSQQPTLVICMAWSGQWLYTD